MKRSQVLVAVIAAILVASSSGWLVRETPERYAAEVRPTPTRADVPETPSLGSALGRTGIALAETKIEAPPSAAPQAPDWGQRLEDSDDFWAFAESAIEPAKRGDGEARYRLALVLNQCEYVYSNYLDEAKTRQRIPQNEPMPSDMVLLEKRCRRLNETRDAPFGSGEDWMDAALAVDNPLAQTNAAHQKAVSSLQNPGSESSRKARSEAIQLILDAVRTRDPEVLVRVGDTAARLAPGDEAEGARRYLSWTLAACLRTPDCEALAQWRKFRCSWDAQCQPYETPRDIIRRDAGSDFDEVERRARELNEKIDAGTLDESDI